MGRKRYILNKGNFYCYFWRMQAKWCFFQAWRENKTKKFLYYASEGLNSGNNATIYRYFWEGRRGVRSHEPRWSSP